MKRFFSFASCVALAGVVSCGARTELFAPDTVGEGAFDASLDAPYDSAVGCTP